MREPPHSSETLTGDLSCVAEDQQAGAKLTLALVVVWSKHEPQRIGENCLITRSAIFGRGESATPGDPPKLELFRQRPGHNDPCGYLEAPTLSRRQWLLEPAEEELSVKDVGKSRLLHNGVLVGSCTAKEGDTLAVDGVLVVLVTRRPRVFPGKASTSFAFGAADSVGIVGESPEIWNTRRQLEMLARRHAHILILGESGTGKELCARAIHQGSVRSQRSLVSRNAATIPEALVEAELFGNARNYPQGNMPARNGLVGQAHGGTLFLDEVGELPEHQQANLLRVLDSGEYQRLGEDQMRTSDLRVIAATNRAPDALKSDFAARFPEQLLLTGLNQRRSDIVLLARALLARLSQEANDGRTMTLSQRLADALCRHQYRLHHRELERILRLAWRDASSDELTVSPAVADELDIPATDGFSPEAIRAALAESKNAQEAARKLGLSSRFALYRVMKRAGIDERNKG